MVDNFFSILLKLEIYSQDRFQKSKSTNQLDFLLIEWYIFGTNCLIGSKTEKNGRKKKLRGHF